MTMYEASIGSRRAMQRHQAGKGVRSQTWLAASHVEHIMAMGKHDGDQVLALIREIDPAAQFCRHARQDPK